VKRRHLLAAVPLAALPLAALAACDPSTTEPSAAPASPVEDPTPVLRGERAEVVAPETLRLPLEMTPMIVVDPGWAATPRQLDGIFLGYADDGAQLTYRAVDQDGTVLWDAARPRSCTGFVLTRGADDRPVAVLADLDPDSLDTMTLTGYDLRTAEQLWGPLDAVGPLVGEGLVLASSQDAPMGPGGPREVLSGADGGVLHREEEGQQVRLLAEHLGTVLQTAGDQLMALSPEGEEQWSIPVPAGLDAAELRVRGRIDPATSIAVLTGADGADGDEGHGVVLDLHDGTVVAEEATAAARDHVLETTVVAAGTLVRGLDSEGAEQWRHEDPEPLTLVSAGERLAYAQREQEGTLVVLDTGQGRMVNPYDVDLSGPLAVPEVFTAESAAAVRVEDSRYLVTSEFDPEFGLRE